MSDISRADEIRRTLEDLGVQVDDIDIKGMQRHGPTRIKIDGYIIPE